MGHLKQEEDIKSINGELRTRLRTLKSKLKRLAYDTVNKRMCEDLRKKKMRKQQEIRLQVQ
jgi:hypothetical protein